MSKLYFCTENKTKLKRALKLLQPEFEIENVNIPIDEPQSDDQQYVAIKKTEQAFNIIKKPLFTQDWGCYISKYNNFPGVITKNVVYGLGKYGLAKIIDENDDGYFQTTFAYKDDINSFVLTAKIMGKFSLKHINDEFETSRTFGNIFIPDGYNDCFARLKEDVANNILKPYYEEFKNKILSFKSK